MRMSNRALTWAFAVIGGMLLVDLALGVYLFHSVAGTAGPAMPAHLGLQVTLASFIFVMVSVMQAFFGFAKLGEIEAKAMTQAQEAARRAVQDMAGQPSPDVLHVPRRAARPGGNTLEGEKETNMGGAPS